ncbi:MAG: hypothetical protein U0V73_13130 [Acidimicrobiia bacterium]
MLTPFDDYPIHQTSLPIAHPESGSPDHYDRFFFNGYREDLYFGVCMATYPNRGIIDAAFSVVHDGVQRSVFASGRLPLDRTQTSIGPITIEILEPLGRTRIRVDAPDQGIGADLVFVPRTAALEEPRQTIVDGPKLVMDYTRLTQWGGWSGTIGDGSGAGGLVLDAETARGTKDRSWGVRPVGLPAPGAPNPILPEIFFLWAPLQFENRCTHFMCFERADGERWLESAAVLPILSPGDPTWGPDLGIEKLAGGAYELHWKHGLRRSEGAAITLHHRSGTAERIVLEPLVTFRMRGIGYANPDWSHGVWKGELAVGGESFPVDALDNVEPSNIHVQQVVRATSETGEQGIGILEQLVFGPHEPTGLHDFLDGYEP